MQSHGALHAVKEEKFFNYLLSALHIFISYSFELSHMNSLKTGVQSGLAFSFFLLVIIFPAIVNATPLSHPFLLFHDIQETPGFQLSTTQPWAGYQAKIIRTADTTLTYNFSGTLGAYDRVIYRSAFARDTGFAYQITKKSEYAQKVQESLLNLDKGKVGSSSDLPEAVGNYAIAYDLIQPTLDPASDAIIRDKLATLADSVYKSLNLNGTNFRYVDFPDFQGKAYPMMGIAGAALSDYTNPNNLPLSSTPGDWTKVGTDYLFIEDPLHAYNRSMFSFGFDEESGKNLLGSYKSYVISEYAWWLQIYNHVYGKNPFEVYPATKKAFTSELWESLPNDYGNDYVTDGNVIWDYHREFANLLNDTEKGEVLNFDEQLDNTSLLPYTTSIEAPPDPALLYSVYGNYNSIQRGYPPETSHLDPSALFQVIRGSWKNDADWMSIVTCNILSYSNRDMAHMDQTAFEYYSRGDLLLSDAGENKYILNRTYSRFETDHNTIAIEDPRNPFPLSSWAGSPIRGMYKGDANELLTPVSIPAMLTTPWIQGIDIRAVITHVMGDTFGTPRSLSSPIYYTRSILYPESDYFIVVDRLEGSEPWKYSTIFRPTSLVTTPSKMQRNHSVLPSDVGHVNGALEIGNQPYDWLSLPYQTETDSGTSTDTISWTTTNPYGNPVGLTIVSVPESDVIVNKLVTRIGGYDARSEVFSPVLRLTNTPSNTLYRITVLLSRYPSEGTKTTSEIPVQGNGNALMVNASGYGDIIYAGDGISSFGGFTTDASVAFIRQDGADIDVTLINGTYLEHGSDSWVLISRNVPFITAKKSGETVEYQTVNDPSLEVSLFNSISGATSIPSMINTDITYPQSMIVSSPQSSGQQGSLNLPSQPPQNTSFLNTIISFLRQILSHI